MKIASVNEIKQELGHLPPNELLAFCLRLVRYKKENKELLTYLLFEAHDLSGYIISVKNDMDEQFSQVNKTNLYQAKKTLRKILRTANKYIRYTGSKEAEAEILIHYCQSLKSSGIKFHKSTALKNIYESQIKKIKIAISSLHEELGYQYGKAVDELQGS